MSEDGKLPAFNEGPAMRGSGMRRIFPIGIAAAILVIAAIIFSAGGPDRTRTAQNNETNLNTTATERAASRSAQPESGVPGRTGDTAQPTPQAPARSSPAGTQ